MNRREFLHGAIAAAPLLAAPFGTGRALAAGRDWGLQLFTVIAPLEKDFEGTLAAVAQLGYRTVETIGSFGRDPALVRRLFDRHGLTSPSQHLAPPALYASFSAWTRREISTEQNRDTYAAALGLDQVDTVVADGIRTAHALGQRYVVWPILMPPHLASREMVDGYIRAFNRAGEMCAKAGLTFAFHNHHREFARLGDAVIYDLILAGTDPALVKMEMDLYWVSKAKADPLAYLQNHPGRFKLAHVKDMAADGDFAVVGAGVLDLPGLIRAADRAGIEHLYVEYDRSDDPLRDVRDARTYLDRLG
ncbi:sugar phosphate isomerase/epimerase [Azospirillum sp. B4]|uniref:sugar phosphate isomerase/epimerase family protein n=1 Tax=Azospirillum sp. B4 TaxID=95605 RepID=UPI0003487BF8|nr:sugar phosphate isomerase/epimerase [Azospirillum sp. B4]